MYYIDAVMVVALIYKIDVIFYKKVKQIKCVDVLVCSYQCCI